MNENRTEQFLASLVACSADDQTQPELVLMLLLVYQRAEGKGEGQWHQLLLYHCLDNKVCVNATPHDKVGLGQFKFVSDGSHCLLGL